MHNAILSNKIKRVVLMSLLIITVLIITLYSSHRVQATSWAEIDAEEVIESAEVIVIGKYELSERGKVKSTVFTGETFLVKGVYKGEAEKIMTAGIDEYDFGWVSEFQAEGGEFLLFLEKNFESGDYLIPVGGPNGMIKVLDGEIIDQSNKNKKRYEKILKEESVAPLNSTEKTVDSNQTFPLTMIVLIILVCILVFIGSYSFRKRITQHN